MTAAVPGPGQPGEALPPSAGNTVLSLEGVSKSFTVGRRHVQALNDIRFTARSGIITGLVGPDGAGKTTLMRLTAGLLEADSGSITVVGLDAARESLAIQASIGYMPQRFGLYEDLTVQENLDLYANLQGVPTASRPARYQELMHMTGLAPFTGRLAGRLSGGMKQKLGLACTLVQPPQLLLLDEPTVGVDPVSRRELWAIIYRLIEQEGVSVLLSTAYLDEAERCEDVALLHEGQFLGHGPPGQFTDRLRGRTFTAHAAGIGKRALQETLLDTPGILDAVIQGDEVRIVGAEEQLPDLGAQTGQAVAVTAVPPRFEDSFIALLKRDADSSHKAAMPAPAAAPSTPSHDTTPVIQVRDLQRRFGTFYAVKGISFEVQRGEIFGLLGANGAGKSTTFRMLCGLLPPSGGHLSVAGLDLRHAAATARARIGYMSQKFSLYGNLTVLENLRFFSSSYGLAGPARKQRVQWALDQFTLTPLAETTSADLPLGFKQRLALACALMHEPHILFLDEPTSGVDPLARREFWRRINALAQAGVTVLVTTHFMEEAEYCDRLAIMDAGEILAIGTPEEVKARTRTADHPHPTLEDAFIALLENNAAAESGA